MNKYIILLIILMNQSMLIKVLEVIETVRDVATLEDSGEYRQL